MLPDDLVTDRQPQTGAVPFCRKKWIKNEGENLVGNEWTLIVNVHTHTPAISAMVYVNGHLPLDFCFHGFHGVLAQVYKNLF